MLGGYFKLCLIVGCFSLATLSATAQEVVHALCGTVRSIDSSAKTITVSTDDGSEGLFRDFPRSNAKQDLLQSYRERCRNYSHNGHLSGFMKNLDLG